MFKLFLAGTALCAATLVTAIASADELTVLSEADPAATALEADPVPPYVPLTQPYERNVPLAPSAESGRAKSLDIDLTVDGKGFKLGGRVSGSKGVSGAWLGVQVRDDGM